jgi:hypothetical protein
MLCCSYAGLHVVLDDIKSFAILVMYAVFLFPLCPFSHLMGLLQKAIGLLIEFQKDESAMGLNPEQRMLLWYSLVRVDMSMSFCRYTLPRPISPRPPQALTYHIHSQTTAKSPASLSELEVGPLSARARLVSYLLFRKGTGKSSSRRSSRSPTCTKKCTS